MPFLSVKDISNNEILRPTDSATFATETEGQLGRRAATMVFATLQAIVQAGASFPPGSE